LQVLNYRTMITKFGTYDGYAEPCKSLSELRERVIKTRKGVRKKTLLLTRNFDQANVNQYSNIPKKREFC
jgi:hypothetical protein